MFRKTTREGQIEPPAYSWLNTNSISEYRLLKKTLQTTNIDLADYNIEHTPTESVACG